MRPYYDHGGITIYHGDCREVLSTLGRSAKCVLTDPPYGISFRSNFGGRFDAIAGDDAVPIEWADNLRRICLPAARIYWFTHESGIAVVRDCLAGLGYQLSRMLVWDKLSPNHGGLEDYSARTEYIVAALAKGCATKLRGARDSNLIAVPRVDGRLLCHPNEKPYTLMSYLIIRSTDPDDLVLDPFCGVGPTLHAARDLGRRAIGIEIEEKYCEIAVRRLEQEVLAFGGVA